MGFLKTLILSAALSSGAFASGHTECDYGKEWSGNLILHYVAHESKEARGWVPTELALCKDSTGVYAIITHRALALGFLADLPLRVVSDSSKMQANQKYTWLVNASSSYDERDAFKLFDQAAVESAVVLTGTKDQVLVIRKELNQVVSNTLFLKEEGSAK
ncbi:hypothetical protein K2X33_07455 [bacterium]|nr:hypothetical protein [bacterium]